MAETSELSIQTCLFNVDIDFNFNEIINKILIQMGVAR